MGENPLPLFIFIINAAQSETLHLALSQCWQEHGRLFEAQVFAVSDIEEERVPVPVVRRALQEATVVFLDIRGGGRAAGLAAATLAATTQPVLVLVGGSPELLRLVRLGSFNFSKIMGPPRTAAQGRERPFSVRRIQNMVRLIERGGSLLPFGRLRHARNWARAIRYWVQGGSENLKNLVVFIGREYAGLKLPKPPPPREYPEFGLYDLWGRRYYQEVTTYFRALGYEPGKPTVGLWFYGGMHFDQSLVPATALAQVLRERYGVQIIGGFATTGHNLTAIRRFFLPEGRSLIDALVYFQWFQLATFTDDDPHETVKLLKLLDVPVLDGTPLYGRTIARWQESIEGLSPVETLTAVILPELDGMIEPLPTAGLEEVPAGAGAAAVSRVAAIPDRVERLAARLAAWIRLRRLPNRDKRVALIIYDNPPGEDNLGSAAYLDVFASLHRLLRRLKDEGYEVGDIPEASEFPERLLAQGLVNDPRWGGGERLLRGGRAVAAARYLTWLTALPAAGELAQVWGEPPGEVMVSQDHLLLPVLELGNVLVGVQPARGYHADPDKISHDKTLPPHHQYVAFYRWLEEEWRPHAVVHVGTHGTLEFLKGKEVGLSRTCWPEMLLGNVPHLYLYHVVNASEATIAKRRSLGVLVNYNSPAFTTSGLYDDYARLDDLIDEYYEATGLDPARAERLVRSIKEQARSLNLRSEEVAEIQEELALMKRSLIPQGLHVLGDDPGMEAQIDFATFLLRYDRGQIPSLHRRLAERKGLDYRELLRPSGAGGKGGRPSRLLTDLDREARELVARALRDQEFPADPDLRRALAYGLEAAGNLGGARELDHLIRGLNGGYIEPGLGGDPLRNPEVLPTGRNSCQFDPRLIPSAEALARGREIAANTLNYYYARHGAYPRSTAVILWGFETTKTRGETVGQVLAYLGVDLEADANPWYKKLKVIPLEDLGRPRVDCLVQICGFFRDMFPNVLDLLHRAFELVSTLDEPEDRNFVRAQTRSLEEQLQGRVPESKLRKIAAGRIFGPRPGEYGTRMINLIETGAWHSEEELSRLFVHHMGHLYAPNLHGELQLAAYQSRLAHIELVSQVRDSHEYEIADLDHYYEFFGGLARSVEAARGRPPEMLITDTTKELIRTESVGEALNRGIRTRLLNPRWIEELLKHEFHGAQKISDRVEYLLGFAATTHAVENWVFSAVTQRYVLDGEMFRRLAANNRFALEAILKRLLEAAQRGYWDASEEELQALRERYLELEGLIEEKIEP
jgi:cobaltochelatase CobN